jgi:hypothetical protein
MYSHPRCYAARLATTPEGALLTLVELERLAEQAPAVERDADELAPATLPA